MKIALVSKLWETTDPTSTGGTGLSVGLLANELVKRGHQVTLFATGDSKTRAKLIAVRNKKWQNDYSEPIEYLNIANAFSEHKKYDIIHTHVEQKAAFFADLVNTPTIMSLRYGEFFADELKILKKYKNLNWLTNSQALQKSLSFIKFKGFVYNGLDLESYPYTEKADNYLLFLARLSPQKGPDIAIQIAKKLGLKLILAGKIVERDKKYLAEKVFKYVDNQQIKYVGEVNFKTKIKLLKKASCLLHPNTVFEACSNVILEAQACGTPVIAYNNGSNSELIINNKTGFIVKNLNEAVTAVKKISLIKRRDCRQNTETNFTVEKMTDNYEKIYSEIINQYDHRK